MPGVSPYKVGDVFGNKKLVEYCGSDPKWRVSLWKYECLLCGKVTGPVKTASITRKDRAGAIPRCCFDGDRQLGNKNPRWLGHEEMSGSFLHSYRYNAQKRGYDWLVTPEELWAQWLTQEGRCAYTGRVLTHGIDASLDRKDNAEGYIPGNVQWVHRDINRMKSDFPEEIFLALCREVVNNDNN